MKENEENTVNFYLNLLNKNIDTMMFHLQSQLRILDQINLEKNEKNKKEALANSGPVRNISTERLAEVEVRKKKAEEELKASNQNAENNTNIEKEK